MEGVVSRVGLQLLLEPSSTAFAFHAASLATGTLYPAYATWKAVLIPKRGAAAAAAGGRGSPSSSSSAALSAGGLAAERWLKYWTIFGLTSLAERLLQGHLDRVPYFYHAKFGFLLWLQLHQGHGASLLFDAWLTPWLLRYERKVDTLLEVGAQAAELFYSTYAGPLTQLRSGLTLGLAHLATFLKWLATPDDVTSDVAPGGCGSSGGRSPVADGSAVASRGRYRQRQQEQQY